MQPKDAICTSEQEELSRIAGAMKGIITGFGGIGFEPHWLTPLELEIQSDGNPFRRGVLVTVATLIARLAEGPKGREALANLGFQPVFQDVEGPRGAGLND